MSPYQREISRQFKGCVLFLLDQSSSMEEPLANSTKCKSEELATALNAWLENMTIAASKGGGIMDYMDVGVLGYRTDDTGGAIIEPGLQGGLSGKKFVSITEIAQNPLRIQSMVQKIFDDETGEMIDLPVEKPVWIEPKASGGTPMCQTLHDAALMLDEWIAEHPTSFPPIVIHITDGESSDGDPRPYADVVKQRGTDDGEVLFFNCHLSATAADSFMFPSNPEILPDDHARILFEMSSLLPEPMYQRAVTDNQFDLKPGARGMAFNADMVSLIKFLDIGTRVASTLR